MGGAESEGKSKIVDGAGAEARSTLWASARGVLGNPGLGRGRDQLGMIARQRERQPAFDQMNPGQIRSASPSG
jgi:hypothetical protein